MTRDQEALARLEAENAALREALIIHKHTDECLRYAAETGRDYCIAACADSRYKALTGASPVVVLTLEEARKMDESLSQCPFCGAHDHEHHVWDHASDCPLAAKIRRAEEGA